MERIDGLRAEHRDLTNFGFRNNWAMNAPKALERDRQRLERELQRSTAPQRGPTPDPDELLKAMFAIANQLGRKVS